MKRKSIALLFGLLLMTAGVFAQTTPATNQVTGPGVHKAKMQPAVTDMAMLKQDKKAAHKAKMAAMTPDERRAFKADRKAKKEARLAAMTPEQRKLHDAKKAQKKAARQKAK